MKHPIVLAIIPARYASTRFPGKPLVQISGISMIERVYMQCMKSSGPDHICVATDDMRIYEHVKGFGGKTVMTSEHHLSGTDRCNEAVSVFSQKYGTDLPDVVVNIQGDEPLIYPELIDEVVAAFTDEAVRIVTAAVPFCDVEAIKNPNTVKVVKKANDDALFFSRSVIPFYRNSEQTDRQYLKHTGIYAYRTETLSQLSELQPSFLEKAESLEQLRWLENGFDIRVIEFGVESPCVDVPEDIEVIEKILRKQTDK